MIIVSDAPAILPAIIFEATPDLSLVSIVLVFLALRAKMPSFDVVCVVLLWKSVKTTDIASVFYVVGDN